MGWAGVYEWHRSLFISPCLSGNRRGTWHRFSWGHKSGPSRDNGECGRERLHMDPLPGGKFPLVTLAGLCRVAVL